jgi:mono/diheme cytochrome c family protein
MSSRPTTLMETGAFAALNMRELPSLLFLMLVLPFADGGATAADSAAANFRREIEPILKEHCYDCHADGANKGQVAFDEFKSDQDILAKPELWSSALKNVRAGLMPPLKKARPTEAQIKALEKWVKADAFGLDPANPDPGRVTLRRLNRTEYRNTIRDLMGFDFKVEEELPPDDTGYGTSPLLLEKYMQAAEAIVAGAVPRVSRVVAEKTFGGTEFRSTGGRPSGDRLSLYDAAKVGQRFTAEHAGLYRISFEVEVMGQFDFDPGRCRVTFKADDVELGQKEYGWQNDKRFKVDFEQQWKSGEHRLALELEPLVPVEQKMNSLDLRLVSVKVEGPLEEKHWGRPGNFEMFFTKDAPESGAARREYAKEILERFVKRAYRRPTDARTIERLVSIAEATWTQPEKKFEDGIAQAMVPVLASPRFLFRVEEAEEKASRYPKVDEYALASRLSYFLWSTMPDEELFRLADRQELRKNLDTQVKRMVADRKMEALVQNFTGQWLQTRDVEGIDINARAVLIRDSGEERDFEKRRQRIQELRAIPEELLKPEEKAELQAIFAQRRGRIGNRPQIELDRELRRALKDETEMAFAHVLRGDRSVLEWISADYTFLNERLARHYNLTNLDVTGREMRRVSLPPGSARGGVLTHGSVLIVTSNPTRTSPVKRGLFILDNVLGLPPPPPPPDVPNLEDSEKPVEGRQPTQREMLAIHREQPLCSSCHNRMDPLGLALENFNALGMWRDTERKQPIDATGRLITGEEFQDIRDVKRVLVANHRLDYYRCLTEKMLTYALGRGPEYYDVETIDQIVARLDQAGGRFSALLMGVIESAPFQKRRSQHVAEASRATEQQADTKEKP